MGYSSLQNQSLLSLKLNNPKTADVKRNVFICNRLVLVGSLRSREVSRTAGSLIYLIACLLSVSYPPDTQLTIVQPSIDRIREDNVTAALQIRPSAYTVHARLPIICIVNKFKSGFLSLSRCCRTRCASLPCLSVSNEYGLPTSYSYTDDVGTHCTSQPYRINETDS